MSWSRDGVVGVEVTIATCGAHGGVVVWESWVWCEREREREREGDKKWPRGGG